MLAATRPGVIKGSVLDICCGVGFHGILAYHQPHTTHVVAMDFNTMALDRARRHAKVSPAAYTVSPRSVWLHAVACLSGMRKQEHAAEQIVFVELDVLQLDRHPELLGVTFDTIVDSASYQCFTLEDRDRYVAALSAFSHTGTTLVCAGVPYS